MSDFKAKVLVVDDDPLVLRAVTEILRRDGFVVVSIDDAVEGLAALSDPSFDVACFDIMMPNLSGLVLLRAARRSRPELEVIMMTAFATVDTALEAVKAGAYDYLTKPFENIDVLSLAVARAAEKKALKTRARSLEEALSTRESFHDLVGQSPRMQQVFKLVETISLSSATVLLIGESGTGKELVARAIHYRSPRKAGAFVPVNCSALSETLLESELFGHVKGAFTGATGNRQGLFEAAHGGTIFLDEIGDVSPAMQARLLRVLQEGEVKPVGSNESVQVDVRVVAATNVELSRAREEGRFREDLYYRLNVVRVDLPPLRERPSDIPLLAQHFLGVYARKANRPVPRLSSAALEALTGAAWPGNVRELENAMERAVVMGSGATVEAEDLPPEVRREDTGVGEVELHALAHLRYAQAKKLALRAFERRYLSAVLEKSNHNVAEAARSAGVDRSNFRRLLKQYGVTTTSPGGGDEG